jgi:hypothetical protein
MMTRLWIRGGALLLVCVTTTPLLAGPVWFIEGPIRCDLRLTAVPAVGDWEVIGPLAPGAQAASTGGYRLDLKRQQADGHARWTVELTRPDGERFRLVDYAYTCRTELGRVGSVFDTRLPERPSVFRQPPQIDVALDIRPNAGIPFMMACDHYGNNRMAVGPIDQTGTYRITGRRDGEDYAITIERNEYAGDGWFTGTSFRDALFVSRQNDFWFDAARAYADAVDDANGYAPRPIPESARRPYYSTWYAFADKIDERIVWDNAVLAREMGIGTFLVFIGWSECESWFSSTNAWGDYTACSSRFSDFPGLIKRIHDELGMAVQVWVAPTWIGEGSESFEQVESYRSKWPEDGYDRNLDPRSPQARAHIRKMFARLARDTGVDGFWGDFLDTVFNRNDAPHERAPALFGAGLSAFTEACYEGFESQHREPIVEYRIPFANLLSKHHASVFTTTYCEHRWDRNRLLAVAHRPFNDGVVSRCDPLSWTDEEFRDRDFVGKTLSAVMMCGPPGISMDLTKMDEGRRKNLKDWFAFYEANREHLTKGRLRPFGREYHYPEMMVSSGTTSYAWISRWETDRIPFPEGTRRAFIFTCLPKDESFIARLDITHVTGLVPGRYRARWYNSTLESHDGAFELTIQPAPPASHVLLKTPRENWDFAPDENRPSLDVRRGGYLELELIN